MNKPIEQYSDAELLAVIRRAEDMNVPGSLYQRANNEWRIRQDQRVLEAAKANRGGIFFEVGGDMTHNSVLQTSEDSVVNIAVAGDFKSKGGKIIQGAGTHDEEKKWSEKPLGVVALAIVAAVVAGWLLFVFGWS